MIHRHAFPALAALALLGASACDRSPTDTAAPRTALAVGAGAGPENSRALAALSRARLSGGPLLAMNSLGNGAVISNGVVRLGILREGHLGADPDGTGTASPYNSYYIGVNYVPTNVEATAPGCICEGWGASADGVSGWANVNFGGAFNLRQISFTEDGVKAVSKVAIDDGSSPWLEVTHDFHPSAATPNLYEVTVTIKNVSGATRSDVRYTRAMDWDIGPTTFREYVTIQGVGATNLIHSSLNGFDTSNPLRSYDDYYGGVNTNLVDAGPNDHGGVFDFKFDALANGEERKFNIYYGAAGTEPDAITAVTRVHAEVYSFGQPSHFTNPGSDEGTAQGFPSVSAADHGAPNTFIFAFGEVGGVALNTPPGTPILGPPGKVYRANEGAPLCLNITASDPDGDALTFVINWGDGTSSTHTTHTPCHVYPDGPRTYTSTLTVVANDGHGGVSPAATTNAAIANVAPAIYRLKLDQGKLNTTKVGALFWAEWYFRDAGVIDMPWTWTVTWGDGTTSTGSVGAQGDGAPVRIEHVYGSPGVKTANFTIRDKDGASHSRAIPVVVSP